jgi:lysophospholipase L1-like esterase
MNGPRLFWALYGIVIVAGIILLAWLSYGILFNAQKPHIIPILAEDQQLNPHSRYRFFYEPKPDVAYKTGDIFNQTNSDTLNEDEGRYAIPKPEEVFRIVVLGDSNTFGFGVARADNYTEVLEDMFSKTACAKRIEVVNLGVPGYDFAYMAERFRLRGAKYDPDLILWNVTNNDFDENEERRQEIFSSLDQTDPYWASRESHERMTREETAESLREHHQRAFLGMRDEYRGRIVYTDFRGPLMPDTRAFLEALSEDSLILFVIPPQWIDRGTDLLPDTHASENGHRKMADMIYRYLIENDLVPCAGTITR